MKNVFFKTVDFASHCAEKFPEKAGIISDARIITFKELSELVKTHAGYLKRYFKNGEIAPIFTKNSEEFVIAVYSLWLAGAVPLPLNSLLPKKKLAEIIKNLGADKIIVLEKNDFPNFGIDEILYTNKSEKGADFTGAEFEEKRRALVLYTSGSSASPKAVGFSFANLFANASSVTKFFRSDERDAWFASLPFFHIGGFAPITRSLFNCSPLIVPSEFSFEKQLETILKFKPAFFSVVQTTLHKLVKSAAEPFPNLKAVFAGGGPINAETMNAAIEKGFPVYKVYGSTETTSMVTILSPEDFKRKPESAGKPFGSVTLSLSNENEIILNGKQIVEGYLDNPTETAKRFKNGEYYTGDIGEIDSEGYLFVKGRKDEFIITGGENVSLPKVKDAVLKLEKIKDAEVFALPDREWGEKLYAAVVMSLPRSEDELKAFLMQHLAKYEIPKKFFFVDKIPRNEMGKTNKNKLLEKIGL